jgi:hypothetical protein
MSDITVYLEAIKLKLVTSCPISHTTSIREVRRM